MRSTNRISRRQYIPARTSSIYVKHAGRSRLQPATIHLGDLFANSSYMAGLACALSFDANGLIIGKRYRPVSRTYQGAVFDCSLPLLNG